jgi:hypothetical protein
VPHFIRLTGKDKGKGHPRKGHEGREVEQRYSSTLSLTSALDGVGGQRHVPAALPPGKTRYPLYRSMGGPQDWSGQVRKISPPIRLAFVLSDFLVNSVTKQRQKNTAHFET